MYQGQRRDETVGTMHMTVQQNGSEVSVSSYFVVDGVRTDSPALKGTVDSTGFFTKTAGGSPLDELEDPDCGLIRDAGWSLTFAGTTASYVGSLTTTYCGNWQFTSTLSR